FVDDFLGVGLAPMKTETTREMWIVIFNRRDRDKGIFQIEPLDFTRRVRCRGALRNFRERLVQEILHRRLLIELVKVGLVPLITRPVEIRKMRERDRSSRQ